MVGAAWKRRAGVGALLVTVGCTTAAPGGRAAPKLVIASAGPADDPDDTPASPAREPAPAVDALVGRWGGTGVQDDNQSWRMVVEVTSTENGRCAHVEYPSVPCAADWICTSRDADGTLHAREELTAGRDRCIDGGAMRLRATRPGEMEWSWVGSGSSAHATLTRVTGS